MITTNFYGNDSTLQRYLEEQLQETYKKMVREAKKEYDVVEFELDRKEEVRCQRFRWHSGECIYEEPTSFGKIG